MGYWVVSILVAWDHDNPQDFMDNDNWDVDHHRDHRDHADHHYDDDDHHIDNQIEEEDDEDDDKQKLGLFF